MKKSSEMVITQDGVQMKHFSKQAPRDKEVQSRRWEPD